MADRTSAGIFGEMFNFLAEGGKKSKEDLIAFLWDSCHGYDFNYCQMDADESLEKLGLAKMCGCGSYLYKGESTEWHTEDACNVKEF